MFIYICIMYLHVCMFIYICIMYLHVCIFIYICIVYLHVCILIYICVMYLHVYICISNSGSCILFVKRAFLKSHVVKWFTLIAAKTQADHSWFVMKSFAKFFIDCYSLLANCQKKVRVFAMLGKLNSLALIAETASCVLP